MVELTNKEAVREVYFWQHSRSDCFNQLILDLFAKADSKNQQKLAFVYPELFDAWSAWQTAGDYGNDLFREHGLLDADKNGSD